MSPIPAADHELEAVAALVNSAYRGESSRAGWTTEADLLGGQRTDADSLRADLAAAPGSLVLTLRDAADAPILASVWLQPAEEGVWYLGMLTVRPDLQDRRLGRRMLEAAESHARERGGKRMRLTVIHLRDELIAWYERRGYRPTGEVQPFPADPRFGLARRDDLTLRVFEKPL